MHRESAAPSLLGKAALAAPTCLVSLGVTEALFRWGSFSLELIGFAALWGGLYGLQSLVVRAFANK